MIKVMFRLHRSTNMIWNQCFVTMRTLSALTNITLAQSTVNASSDDIVRLNWKTGDSSGVIFFPN